MRTGEPNGPSPAAGGCRVLITNDDGIGSEGLRRLALVAVEAGLDVVVAAPERNASGASASLTAVEADGRVIVERVSLAGLDQVPAYAVRAAPAFITLIATRGAFGPPPDVVLSGVNLGLNTGHAILHSGTVGAAFTGRAAGCRALAVSVAVGDPVRWDTAAAVAGRALGAVLEAEQPLVLNVNVPDVAPGELRGVRRARLASFGAVQTTISEIGSGFVRITVSDIEAELEPGTDAALVAEGFATVTPLHPLCVAEEVAVEGLTGERSDAWPPGGDGRSDGRRRAGRDSGRRTGGSSFTRLPGSPPARAAAPVDTRRRT